MEEDLPLTSIQQHTGHKHISSINNYAVNSVKYCLYQDHYLANPIGINYKFSAHFQGQRDFVFFITAIWWFLSEIQIECPPLYYRLFRFEKYLSEISGFISFKANNKKHEFPFKSWKFSADLNEMITSRLCILSGPDAEFHVLVLSLLFCVVSGWGLLHGIYCTVAVFVHYLIHYFQF
jgi:hypothetical protein